MVSQPGQIFIGRRREMETLLAALDDAQQGRGRVVMLVGEPGIGKTRTAQELASLARDKGAHILWGWCYDQQGAPAYWPWLQAIRSYVQQQDPDMLRLEMGPGAADIAEIVPDINQKLPGLTPPPPLEPEQARFRLFDSIATFLTTASRHQTLVLVLDDLHWADKPSLLLLEFLVRQIADSRIMVVGCYRDTEVTRHHPLPETLAQLSREPVFKRESLRGLSHEDSDQFIEDSLKASSDASLSQELLDTVYDRTEGNPFFTSEVIRLLSDSGDLDPERADSAHAIRIPDGVREVIGQRLNRLSERCNQALTMASVIGREFDFNLLRRLDQAISEEQWLEGIDEGVAARLIEEAPEEIDRYRFSHALIQQSLSEELTTSRRVRLHARIGQALEELYGEDPDVSGHAAELTYHFAEAEAVLGPEKLVRYSLLAGERALATYAYEGAQANFERGLVARGISFSGTEAASDEEAADLLFGLARARSATGVGLQLVEAFAILSRAFEYYADAGNVAQAVAAAEFPITSPAYRIPGAAELMARALALVPADSHEAGRLLSRYGEPLGAEGDYEGAQDALGRALTIARRQEDVPLEVQTLTYAADVSGLHLQWRESVDHGLRAIELAIGDQYALPQMLSRYWTSISFLSMGDLEAARPHALALRDLAERRSTPRQIASNALTPITTLSCLEGDWNAGRESSDWGAELAPQNPQLLGPRTLLEYETGESAEGEVYLERLLDVMRRTGPVQLIASGRTSLAIPTIARITGVLDRLELAEAAAKSVLSERSATPIFAMWAKSSLAMLAVQNGNQSAADEHYSYLLEQRGTMLWTVTTVDRLLGLLSQTMGNMDQSADHFDDALDFCRKAGYRPELAWTCYDHAQSLLQRNRPGDRVKAVSLLDEGLNIATELGMIPLMDKVAALQEEMGSKPAKTPAYPDGLTQREVEVLRLISGGKTDREIGDELFISVKTVGNHVSNILNKTGVANRTEAATYAARRGLAVDEDPDVG